MARDQSINAAYRAVAMALFAILPGLLTQAAIAQAADIAKIPETLRQPFAAATVAADRFNATDARLAQALAGERRVGRTDSPPASLRRESLSAFLRPWDYSVYRNYEDGGQGRTGRLPADVVELLAQEYARESARWDAVPKDLGDEAKAKLSPPTAGLFAEALSDWIEYRRLVCGLAGEYLQQRAPPAAGRREAAPDRLCMTVFTNNLQLDAGEILRSAARAGPQPSGELPEFAVEGSKFHYLAIHSAERSQANHQRQTVHVTISDASAPLIVMLQAYEPIEWAIQLGKGVKLRQVVLYGHYKPTYRFDGPAAPIRAYSEEEGNHEQIWKYLSGGQADRLELREALTGMTGLLPATMQFDACLKDTCLIDGQRSSPQYQSSRPSQTAPAQSAGHRTHKPR